MEFESIDEQLHHLALTAKAYPVASRPRQQALSQILQILRQPDLLRARRRRGITEDLWKEALQSTLIYVCEKIDNYDPNKGCSFLAWFSTHLKWRQQDAEVRKNQPDMIFLEDLLGGSQNDDDLNQNWEERFSESSLNSNSESLISQLRTFFYEDPDNKFRSSHMLRKPEVTFQVLALRVFDGVTYREMSKDFDVPIPSLSCFFQRKLAEFAPYIRDYFLDD